MDQVNRQTRSYLMKLFEKNGISPRTFLGQNFLIDLNIIEFIVREATLTREDLVLEVGSGTGGMTSFMAREAGEIISVDVDPHMIKLATQATLAFDNVQLINQDILKNKNNIQPEILDLLKEKLSQGSLSRLKLVANLPYSIATPLISNLIASDVPWDEMVVTIQLELGQRFVAGPGSSHYGSLSVWLQSQADVEIIKKLPPTVFWPRPKVNSAIVRLFPNEEKKSQILDRPFFQDFVRRLFHQRRKFLRSTIAGMFRKQLTKPEVDAVLKEMELKPNCRAEELPVKDLVELSNCFYRKIQETADSV